MRQLSLNGFLTGRLGLFVFVTCFEEYICAKWQVILLIFGFQEEGYTSLLLPQSTPLCATACFMQTISDWNFHPFHLMFSFS